MKLFFRKAKVYSGRTEVKTLPTGSAKAVAGLMNGWSFISTSAGGGVSAGAGAPVAAPAGTAAIYIQTDSNPANQIWTYANGAWA